jgi:hypothetical protein
MYGKQKENRKAGQKFSEWVADAFPGLSMRDASDAQWFAENSETVSDSCTVTHPTRIRQEHNEQQAAQAIPEDLQAVSATPAAVMSQRSAEKAAKVIQRAAGQRAGAKRGLVASTMCNASRCWKPRE